MDVVVRTLKSNFVDFLSDTSLKIGHMGMCRWVTSTNSTKSTKIGIKGGNNDNISKGKITSINASQCILYSNKVQTKLKQPASNYTADVMTRNLAADFIPIYIKGSKKHVESLRDSISQSI